MDVTVLLDALVEPLYQGALDHLRRPRCEVDGHRAGHTCLDVPDFESLFLLAEELSCRHGSPRALAVDGDVDPAVNDRSGLPLLAPFGARLVSMRAWMYGGRWVGCGTVRGDDGDTRPVALVAERRLPEPDELPADASWVDKLVLLTGWDPDRRSQADWAAAEARLGTALPSDYKELIERFGDGTFDGYLDIHLPDRIRRHAEDLAGFAEGHGSSQWEPYRPFPAPGGLLWWASSEHEQDFCWLTEDPDPDRWPVLHRDVGPVPWERYHGTTAEFVFRMLTDPAHPYPAPGVFAAHWFSGAEPPAPGWS
ncbi:SMI1/KNR4 family protein [Peterkaempfera griseoplana]|uniref:SMI1/KNR4 family protein n=1 Tax=Peterkaempfera griseoplana TaxID=66896 RepID=UPI0006E3DD29|nr:SMI1/KNR4 family protein [Peterkaempfera griseoplana]